MPQIFQVLRCYKCAIFQIHLRRKDFKWACKVCGEKQSVKRHYGIGTGKDCRMHVQKLNQMRGDKEEIKVYHSEDSDYDDTYEDTKKLEYINKIKKIKSKWASYVDNQEEHEINESEPQYLDDKEVVLEIPQKRKVRKKFNKPTKVSKSSLEHSEPETFTNEECSKSQHTEFNKGINCNLAVKSFSSRNILDEAEIKSTLMVNECNDETILKSKNKIFNSEQKIESTSKWATYVEENDNIDENSEENIENALENTVENSHTKSLFSLCDDSDLDNILDF